MSEFEIALLSCAAQMWNQITLLRSAVQWRVDEYARFCHWKYLSLQVISLCYNNFAVCFIWNCQTSSGQKMRQICQDLIRYFGCTDHANSTCFLLEVLLEICALKHKNFEINSISFDFHKKEIWCIYNSGLRLWTIFQTGETFPLIRC